ncbi:MAG: hypothetical protein JOZ41_03560 [Chloroflexi bacterium]|nr:hypothetical protein [Chloroflexota bacterium]
MYKTWCASAEDPETLARVLEAHLNEFADEVVSVSYSVDRHHHVLAVYRPVEPGELGSQQAAVTVAERIIDHAQS